MSARSLYLTPRMISLLFLGFSSGLPFALTYGTLQAWMDNEGIDIRLLGIFGLVRAPYALKFLWAPFLDRYVVPFLGRRRGWIFITQVLLAALLYVFSELSPKDSMGLVALLAFLVAFMSSSQDIVIDAYRVEILPKEEHAAGGAVGVFGWRLGLLASGTLALILAHTLPWGVVYKLMALFMLMGIGATLLAEKETTSKEFIPRKLSSAAIDPLKDFLRRPYAWEILLFMVLYKLGDVMALHLITKFYLDMGFSKLEIGTIAKFVGLAAVIIGGLLGGTILHKIPLKRGLFIFGILQGLSSAVFIFLLWCGKNLYALALAVAVENLFIGLGTAAYVAYMMRLCNIRFTATQYALLSSLSQLTSIFFTPSTGYMVSSIGWGWFFAICILLSFPGLVLVYMRYDKWESE